MMSIDDQRYLNGDSALMYLLRTITRHSRWHVNQARTSPGPGTLACHTH